MKILNHPHPHLQFRSSRRQEALTGSRFAGSATNVVQPVHLSAEPNAFQRFNVSTFQRAFTLVEIMLVVAIIGILAALVIPRIAGKSEQARVTAAQADINGGIKTALGEFEVDNGFYPQTLQDLLQHPRNARNWHGPYLDSLPVDPWGNAYLYSYPGKHNANGYDLWSAGPDGKSGDQDDIGNWQTTQ